MKLLSLALAMFLPLIVGPVSIKAAPSSTPAATRGEAGLAEYFKTETARLSARGLKELDTLEAWNGRREQMRENLADMLGLWPWPERTELKSVVTGRVEHEQFTVENLHFQSRPGLYVTANLYLPKGEVKPRPAVLYLCGHGPVISNGVSYGNKVTYQHHGAWFARNGYVCLILDSLQLGEIQGLHHGTHRENLWWWNARGYTPAGVEAWNSIRALDYLSTRAEVDASRFGVTGRSGGGAYSWWLATLDDRVKVAAPVAGITDLQNHVVDGVVEGHCDCMFTVNTHGWDYPHVAALVAPRPLLIVNTDSDSIFPLDGVQRVHAQVREIYKLHGAADKLGLVIGPGPHKDTQDLQVPVMRWFNRHLRGEEPLIDSAAVKLFTPEQLRVFKDLPSDSINTNIHETFVAMAKAPAVPDSGGDWGSQRQEWMAALEKKSFGGWPELAGLDLQRKAWSEKDGVRFEVWEFSSQDAVRLRFYIAQAAPAKARRRDHAPSILLNVLGETEVGGRIELPACPTYDEWLATASTLFPEALQEERMAAALPPGDADTQGLGPWRQDLSAQPFLVWFAPRGIGLTAWDGVPRKRVQIRRRFMLLGQTLDGMRVWDVRRAIQALRSRDEWRTASLTLRAAEDLACDSVYASLFERVEALELWRMPSSHRTGPDYLNVLRVLDVPQALAMAVERSRVTLHDTPAETTAYARDVARRLGWDSGRLR